MRESASRSNRLRSLKRNRDQDAELVERQCWHFLELEVTDFGETQAWGSRAFSGGGGSMLLEGRKGGTHHASAEHSRSHSRVQDDPRGTVICRV